MNGTTYFIAVSFGLLLSPASSFAANVYVAPASGPDLPPSRSLQVTNLVRRAVQNMPEHTLVESEFDSDFVLRPTVIHRDEDDILRIEKERAQKTLSVAEQTLHLSGLSGSEADVQQVTQKVIQGDVQVAAIPPRKTDANVGSRNPRPSDASYAGSISGATSSADQVYNPVLNGDELDTRSIHTDATNQLPPGSLRGSEVTTGLSEPGAADVAFNDPSELSGNRSPAGSGNLGPYQNTADVRAPSPRIASERLAGFSQLGAGPAFGIGLNSSSLMYDINAAYNYNLSAQVTAKAFGDFNLATGSDASQFVNLGVGAQYYPDILPNVIAAKPYIGGDVGYGFARSGDTRSTNDGVTLGAETGFRFEAKQLNWDINAHYSVLTTEIGGKTPSVLSFRAAVNF